MACTFPAVLFFQLAALPFAAIILGLALFAIRLIDPHIGLETANPVIIAIQLTLVLAEFTFFGAMSLLGFIEGWQTGWLVARGQSMRSVIARGPSARLLNAFKRRR